MATSVADKRAAFRRLHEAGCFVLPNPWDVGSAALLQHLGFKALATTSAGMAWSMGCADGGVGLEQALDHFSQLARATDLPVNADFENAFGDAPNEVAKNVALAADTGIAGLSVEDYSGREIYEFDLGLYQMPTLSRYAVFSPFSVFRMPRAIGLSSRSFGEAYSYVSTVRKTGLCAQTSAGSRRNLVTHCVAH